MPIWCNMQANDTELQACFVLHSRRYRDTSLLVELFSRVQGRFTMVARGARGKKSRFAGSLQLFVPLLVSSFGRGEMKTAKNIEINGAAYNLTGRNLLIGLYVNELLYRLLGKYDPLEELYDRYEQLINLLQVNDLPPSILRSFELSLLSDLGYAVSFDVEAESGNPISAGKDYSFRVHSGFHVAGSTGPGAIRGEHLLAIADGRIDTTTDQIAKRITRQSFDQLLAGKPLNSRALFERYLQPGGDS